MTIVRAEYHADSKFGSWELECTCREAMAAAFSCSEDEILAPDGVYTIKAKTEMGKIHVKIDIEVGITPSRSANLQDRLSQFVAWVAVVLGEHLIITAAVKLVEYASTSTLHEPINVRLLEAADADPKVQELVAWRKQIHA